MAVKQNLVHCSLGNHTVERKRAWRKRVLYSKGEGGSLGRVKLMESLNEYACEPCVLQRECEQTVKKTFDGGLLDQSEEAPA